MMTWPRTSAASCLLWAPSSSQANLAPEVLKLLKLAVAASLHFSPCHSFHLFVPHECLVPHACRRLWPHHKWTPRLEVRPLPKRTQHRKVAGNTLAALIRLILQSLQRNHHSHLIQCHLQAANIIVSASWKRAKVRWTPGSHKCAFGCTKCISKCLCVMFGMRGGRSPVVGNFPCLPRTKLKRYLLRVL